MVPSALQRLLSHFASGSAPDPARARSFFLIAQLAFAGLILFLIYLASRGRESGFRVREADKKDPRTRKPVIPGSHDPLAEARIRRQEPLRLSGIRIDGEPHETLGISRNASVAQIQNAYRELMKRYHPDIVGRPGTREWSDAQKIAEALNQARAKMLESHSQSPNRSGR